MKNIHLIPIVAAAAILCVTACNKIDKTDPINSDQTCTIVYTIDNQENRTTVKSESDWELMLNQFCDYAQDGKTVTFHNLRSLPADLHSGKSLRKSNSDTTPNTITTTSRDEIKSWMRKMEQSGKTVNITYNSQTGVWSGRAYANAVMTEDTSTGTAYHGVITTFSLSGLDFPSLPNLTVMALRVNADTTLLLVRDNYFIDAEGGLDDYEIGDTATLSGTLMVIEDFGSSPLLVLDITVNDPATFIGTWQYTCLTEYSLGDGLNYLNVVSQNTPVENGNSIYYSFLSDGTATRTVGTASSSSENGSWSLSNNLFYCDLPDMSGSGWDIVWLTSSTMIISRTGNDDGTVIYQMMLEQISR